jgi:hypothetical protein
MKRLVYVSILVFLSIVFINVKAATCNETEYQQKLEIAKNIKITYQHIDGPSYDLVITNLSKDMELIDDVNERFIKGTGEVLTLHYYYAGVYTFRVFSNSGTCKNQRIHTLMIQIPRYNTFADTDYCKDNPDFKYCDPWYKGYISLEMFSDGITEYEKEKASKNQGEVKKSFLLGLSDFYKDNKLYIWIGTLAIVLVASGFIVYSVYNRRKIKL